jgi:glycerol-3-phosphate O-acyltransferase / dihydroxyacetone phosphate acyltransferase
MTHVFPRSLVDLFSTPWDSDPAYISLKRSLITYHSLLKSSRLTNGALASLPLPRTKRTSNPKNTLPIPGRLSTILPLLRETFSVLIRLPLFLVPLLVHLPAYYVTRWVGDKSARDEETMAQNKLVVGLFVFLAIYSFWFWIIFALFRSTPIGAVVAAITIWGMEFYHGRLIDDNYLRCILPFRLNEAAQADHWYPHSQS